jgi:hypothetical protein
MKKTFYKVCLAVGFLIQFTDASAQVVWGVGSSVGVADAEFSNNFVNSTTAGSYSTTNWTALAVNEDDATVFPGNAYWVRNTNGVSSGGYATGMTPIGSPSAANGSALFDSDFMDNGGVTGAFGSGTSPGGHKGELISPRIDLTGNTNNQLAVNFYSYYRRFQIDNYSISISTDDGASWTETVDIQALQPVAVNSDVEGFITAVFNTATQGVSNLTQCRIKFTFDGYYYYAFVDDISIIGFSCTNNPPTNTITSTICNSESIVVNGNTYNAANPSGTEVLPGAGLFGCDSTITINLNVLPALNGANTTTICSTESLVINGTIYDASNPTGTEVFTNVGVNGCDSTVTVNLNVLPVLSGTNTTTICADETLLINGTPYNATNPTGTEVFTNVGVNGCDSTVTVNLNVLAPVTISTTVNSETITATVTGASYQWLNCDNGNSEIAGATNQSFTATSNGNYAVEITENGCVDTSACVFIGSTSIATLDVESGLQIFPNPTNGECNIMVSESMIGQFISLTNSMGQLLEIKMINHTYIDFDLNNYSDGIYFIQLKTSLGVINQKVIKN